MRSSRSASKKANSVADWLEIAALSSSKPVTAVDAREKAREYGFSEEDIGVGMSTVGWRTEALGEAYPFRTASGSITASLDARVYPWVVLSMMSKGSPVRPSVKLKPAAELLEHLVADALRALFGPNTVSTRFAWPSDEGRPRAFPDAVRWLARRMGVDVGHAYRSPYAKDGGVDVVAWRPFPDGRSGFPVILVQCTLEGDYEHKVEDIDTRIWAAWLRLDFDPMRALAIPDVVPSGEAWNRVASRATILDRVRIASLLGHPRDCPDAVKRSQAWMEEARLLQGIRLT